MASRSSASEAPAARLPLAGPGCSHVAELGEPAAPSTERCGECGAERVLRICLTCGHVGCCDSRNGHATAHAAETGHRLIQAWKGGNFVYCYEHGYL